MKIFVITIERGKDRFETFEKHMNMYNIPYEVFYGVDGKITDFETHKKYITKFGYNFCTRSMLGCALSHFYLLRYIGNNDIFQPYDKFLILEDDTLLQPTLYERVLPVVEELLDDQSISIVQLSGDGIFLESQRQSGEFLFNEYKSHYITAGYSFTKNTAKEISDQLLHDKINYHIDFQIFRLLKNQNKTVLTITPNIAIQGGWDNTTIADGSSYISGELNYILTFPIIRIHILVINFFFLISFLFIIILLLVDNNINVLYWLSGLLLYNAVTFDY